MGELWGRSMRTFLLVLAAFVWASGTSWAGESKPCNDENLSACPPEYRALTYNDRGLLYVMAGDYNRAVGNFDDAIRNSPKLALLYYNRSLVYEKKGDSARASADYNKAISIDPKLAQRKKDFIHQARSAPRDARNDQNDCFMADISACTRIIDGRSPGNKARAYTSRGLSYLMESNYDGAIAEFNEAIRIDPKNSAAYSNRGVAYRKKGDNARAEADLKEAARLNPK